MVSFLEDVKNALGITGDYQDATLTLYIDAVIDYLIDSGVKRENIDKGIVIKGVTDIWTYGAGETKFSSFFMQRASQLAYKG